MIRQYILSIINDLILTIGTEQKRQPLLIKVLQRFMFHTGMPVGIALIDPQIKSSGVCFQNITVIGDRKLRLITELSLPITCMQSHSISELSPKAISELFPVTSKSYACGLILPMQNQGLIALLSPVKPEKTIPYEEIFKPVLAHLKQTLYLCHQNEQYQDALLTEKRAIQKELEITYSDREKERAFLNNLKDTIPDLVWTKDTNGVFISCNAAFEAFYDAPEAEIIGKTDYDFVSAELANSFREMDKRAILSHSTQCNEEWVVYPDGHAALLDTRKTPIYDAKGVLIGVVGVARDITQTRQIQNSLNERRNLYSTIVEQAVDPIVLIEANTGKFLEFNTAAHQLLGYRREEFAQLYLPDIDVSLTPTMVFERLGAMHFNVSSNFESQQRRKDGDIIDVSVRAKKIRVKNKTCIAAIWSDITEQKRTAEQLRKLSMAVEQSPSSIVITDLEGKIEYVNEAFVRITGWQRDEVIGENPRVLKSDLTPPDQYLQMWDKLTKGEGWSGEFINRRKDSSIYNELARIVPIRQPDGSITHYLAIKEDITEFKRIQQELERHRDHLEELVQERSTEITRLNEQLQQRINDVEAATKAKSEFLANMSHEIRTPMNTIIALSQLILTTDLTPKQDDYLNKIKNASEHLLGIINDILDFSKIEAGKTKLEHIIFNLPQTIQQIANLVTPRTEEKSLIWSVEIAPDIPENLIGDPLRLKQILINFISNAIKFTEHGYIKLHIQKIYKASEQVELKFSVEDTGIGLSEKQINNLFQSFNQADSSTTRKYGGTGLGLAISYHLAELMNGSVGVKSKLNEGSTFWLNVSLPYLATTKKGSAPLENLSSANENQQNSAEHMLFKENKVFSENIREILERLTVLLIDNDLEAAALFRDYRQELESVFSVSQLQPLSKAINSFDFEEAISMVNALTSWTESQFMTKEFL